MLGSGELAKCTAQIPHGDLVLNATHAEFRPALHYATREGNITLTYLFLSKGALAKVRYTNGQTEKVRVTADERCSHINAM